MAPYPRAVERFPKLRQSMLGSFDNCPLSTKFSLDYDYLPDLVDGEGKPVRDANGQAPDWSGHPQGRGTLFHRFAAKALEELAAQEEEKLETDVAHAILVEVVRQHDVPDHEVVAVPMAHLADLYWIVTKWAHDNTWSVRDLVECERRIDAPIRYPDPDGGWVERTMTGQVDALFVHGEEMDAATLLDWKDTWALPGPKEISFEGFFQQRFYAWLIFKEFSPIQSVTLREFYVRFSETREATIWRTDMEEIESEIAALVERFDRAYHTGIYKPSPGKHCGWCHRPTACPIFPKARGEGAIESQGEAEKVAAQLLVAKAAADQLQKALRSWATTHGSVPVKDAKEPNRVYGFRESTRTERPKREVLEGMEGERLTQRQIDALYPSKKGTRFESFIPKPEVEPDDEIVAKLKLAADDANRRAA